MEMHSVAPRQTSAGDKTAVSPHAQTAAAINNDSFVSGFSGRALTKAIDESGEELADALFGLLAKLQKKRSGLNEKKPPVTSVRRTKQVRLESVC